MLKAQSASDIFASRQCLHRRVNQAAVMAAARNGFITREVVLNLHPLLVGRSFVGPLNLLCLSAFIEACVLNEHVIFDDTEVRGRPKGMSSPIDVVAAVAQCKVFKELSSCRVLSGINFEESVGDVKDRIEIGRAVNTLPDLFDGAYGNERVAYFGGFEAKGELQTTEQYIALHCRTRDAFNRKHLDLPRDRYSGCNPDIEDWKAYDVIQEVGIDFAYIFDGRIADLLCVGLAGDLKRLHVYNSPFEAPHLLVRGKAVNDLCDRIYKRMSQRAGSELQEMGLKIMSPQIPVITPIAIQMCNGDLDNLGSVILDLRAKFEPVRSLTQKFDQLQALPATARDLLDITRELDAAWEALPGRNSPREKALQYGSWWFSQFIAAWVHPGFVMETIVNKIIDRLSDRFGELPRRPINKVVTSFIETLDVLSHEYDLRHSISKLAKETAPPDNWRAMAQLSQLNYALTYPEDARQGP